MKRGVNYLLIIIPLVWSGLILGISFLETPLKFKAPHITKLLGLGIGKVVFSALNTVEISLATLLFLAFLSQKLRQKTFFISLFILLILAIQTFYLLPFLANSITLMQAGITVKDSPHHFIYIIFEVIKLILLLVVGIQKIKAYSS
jgi:hypothetical protein